MKNIKIPFIALMFSIAFASCDSESVDNTYNETGLIEIATDLKVSEDFLNQIYVQEDQVARPAINTVFSATDPLKDAFNVTIPSNQFDEFQPDFQDRLEALNPAYQDPTYVNLLGLNSEAFTTVLATDVLNISLVGTTTFFDGTNVLTGRTLADDVIDVELILIFGGPTGGDNPGLTSDNVDANDVAFLDNFPYLAAPH